MRRSRALVGVVMATAFGAGACDSDSLRGAGESCFASSECGPGLVCDLAADPPVCSGTGVVPADPDAPPAQVFDAGPSPDQPDGGPTPPDAAPPDAGVPDAAPPDAASPDAAPPDAA